MFKTDDLICQGFLEDTVDDVARCELLVRKPRKFEEALAWEIYSNAASLDSSLTLQLATCNLQRLAQWQQL
jgi:hypothetical protein